MRIILKIEEYFISILFSLITLTVLLEVVFRYLLYFSLAWVEDIAMFFFIWFIGIGASVTAAKKADIRITVLFDRLPPKLKLITEVAIFVLWGILLIAVTLNAWKMASLMFRMVDNDIGAVIVVDKGKPVGIITEKDVLERVIMRNKHVYKTKANEIMSTPLISIEINRPIKEALKLMHRHKIRRLAVIENEMLAGLVTERRLLMGFLSQVY